LSGGFNPHHCPPWHTFKVAVSTIISLVSLLVVAVLGLWNIYLGKRTTKASEDSAKATERAVKASERGVALAEQDAKCRRLAGVLEVVMEMRELYNEQLIANAYIPGGFSYLTGWQPATGSPEMVDRTALYSKLMGRLVLVEKELGPNSKVQALTSTGCLWTTGQLDGAVDDVTAVLRTAAMPTDSSGSGT
jgi:hypothetical protein